MQGSWRNDGDKLTFIIGQRFNSVHEENSDTQTVTVSGEKANLQDEIDAMVGDVNLFISTRELDEKTPHTVVIGELELMIASPTHRRKGFGKAALLLFLKYIIHHEREILEELHGGACPYTLPLPIDRLSTDLDPACAGWQFDHFAVKIGRTNHKSIALFEGLGFSKTSVVPSYFGEFELRLRREEVSDVVSLLDNRELGREGVGRDWVKEYRCECDACEKQLGVSMSLGETG